jgi:hypothetical protein
VNIFSFISRLNSFIVCAALCFTLFLGFLGLYALCDIDVFNVELLNLF